MFVTNQAGAVKFGRTNSVLLPSGRPLAPIQVRAEIMEGDAVRIQWADASDNEIGFRVDRQIGNGPWSPIAYRPPRIEGTAVNLQTWVDFLAPAGRPLRYRVVAVNPEDSSAAASAATEPIRLDQEL